MTTGSVSIQELEWLFPESEREEGIVLWGQFLDGDGDTDALGERIEVLFPKTPSFSGEVVRATNVPLGPAEALRRVRVRGMALYSEFVGGVQITDGGEFVDVRMHRGDKLNVNSYVIIGR